MADTRTEWFQLEGLIGGDYPTLSNLSEYLQLGGRCVSCERTGAVDRYELQARFGKNTYIIQLSRLLRCRKCGSKGSNKFVVAKMPR